RFIAVGTPQDAYPDDPQSRREVQAVCLWRGFPGGTRRRAGSGDPSPASEERQAVLLGMWSVGSCLRRAGGTPVRVGAALGNRGVSSLPDAAGGLQTLRCDQPRSSFITHPNTAVG